MIQGTEVFPTISAARRASEIYRQRIKKVLQGKKLEVAACGQKFSTVFDVGKYTQNNRASIELVMDNAEHDPFCILTCNLNHVPLKDREIIVKTWSENEETSRCALASGLFRDTGKRVSTGFVQAQIWEVL